MKQTLAPAVSMFARHGTLVTAIAVVILTVIVYWPVTANGLVWDDHQYLSNVEYLDPEYWRKVIGQSFFISENYFRPAVVITFVFQNWLHGVDAFWLHFVNLLLHALNAGLVVVLARHLLSQSVDQARSALIAGAVGLFYGLHPVTVEATAWISGRFDLLLTTFLLFAMLADSILRHRILRPLVVGLLFTAAAFSKEMALAFPFVLFAWHLALAPRPLLPVRLFVENLRYRGELQVYIAIAIGGFVYLIVRYAALGGLLRGLNEHLSTDGLARVLLIAKTYGWYLLLTFYPFTLVSPAHPERIPLSASDPAAWLALVAVFGLLFAMYKLVCKKPHIGWSWAMFPVSLLPVAHGAMLQVTTNIVAERFLYYPLALASLALAPTLFAIARTMKEHVRSEVVRMVAAFIFLMYLGLSIASTRSMIPLWHDDIRLWTWALQRNPESAGAQANLANHYIVARQPQLGLRHAINALRISPKHAFAWSLVGNALADLGHCEDALRYQQVALGIKPLDTDTINSIGVILLQYGKLKAAEEFLQYGLVKNLWNRRINYNLIFVYLSLNDHNKAQVHLDHAWHALDETTKPKLATFEGNTAVNVPCTTSGSVLNSNADNSLFPKLDMGDTPPLWLLTPKQAATKYSISVSFDAGLIKVDMHPQ